MRTSQAHRVIIYGSRNDGDDITEHELKGLIQTLRSKGFNDAYYVRDSPHRTMESLREYVRLFTS